MALVTTILAKIWVETRLWTIANTMPNSFTIDALNLGSVFIFDAFFLAILDAVAEFYAIFISVFFQSLMSGYATLSLLTSTTMTFELSRLEHKSTVLETFQVLLRRLGPGRRHSWARTLRTKLEAQYILPV